MASTLSPILVSISEWKPLTPCNGIEFQYSDASESSFRDNLFLIPPGAPITLNLCSIIIVTKYNVTRVNTLQNVKRTFLEYFSSY